MLLLVTGSVNKMGAKELQSKKMEIREEIKGLRKKMWFNSLFCITQVKDNHNLAGILQSSGYLAFIWAAIQLAVGNPIGGSLPLTLQFLGGTLAFSTAITAAALAVNYNKSGLKAKKNELKDIEDKIDSYVNTFDGKSQSITNNNEKQITESKIKSTYHLNSNQIIQDEISELKSFREKVIRDSQNNTIDSENKTK